MPFDLMHKEKTYLQMLKEAEIMNYVGKGPEHPAPKEKEAKTSTDHGEGTGTEQAGTETPNELPPVSDLEKELAKEEKRIIGGGLVEDIKSILEKKVDISELDLKARNRIASATRANLGMPAEKRYVPGGPGAATAGMQASPPSSSSRDQAARAYLASKRMREQDEELEKHDEENETPEEEKAESPEFQKKEKEAGKEKHDTETGEVKESSMLNPYPKAAALQKSVEKSKKENPAFWNAVRTKQRRVELAKRKMAGAQMAARKKVEFPSQMTNVGGIARRALRASNQTRESWNQQMKEAIQKVLREQEEAKVKIPVKHPGVLEVPEGKDVESLGEDHFKALIDKKGWEEISKALTNLHTWNKDKNPSLASWANGMQEKLAKWVENKRESGQMKEQIAMRPDALNRLRQPVGAPGSAASKPAPAAISQQPRVPVPRPVATSSRVAGQPIPDRNLRTRL